MLRSDYTRLELKWKETLEAQAISQEHSSDIKRVEEEMTYLKRHYEMELGLLKDENEILKRELNSLSLIPAMACTN